VDIRPAGEVAASGAPAQEVTYYGGVEHTVVGAWLFRFDHWMKLAAAGRERIPVDGVPAYWSRAVDVLGAEVAACNSTAAAHWTRHNRYWLCADDVRAVEDGDAAVFEGRILRVLAERLGGSDGASRAASPCSSAGTDDPLATEFAALLTAHLDELGSTVPVAEIGDFARLIAGFSWLAEHDPTRDLRPWLNGATHAADTPDSVPTLTQTATRDHPIRTGAAAGVHSHRLELSGGVIIAPRRTRVRSADDTLRRLRRAVLLNQPDPRAPFWRFAFTP
jgi:hypothetical protein